jgi:hypothetical protein
MAIRCRTVEKSRTVFELYSAANRWIKGFMWGVRDRDIDRGAELPGRGFAGYSSMRRPKNADCFCLAGAVKRIYTTKAKRNAAYVRLAVAINTIIVRTGQTATAMQYPLKTSATEIEDVISSVIAWNDSPGRKYSEIRQAAKEARV